MGSIGIGKWSQKIVRVRHHCLARGTMYTRTWTFLTDTKRRIISVPNLQKMNRGYSVLPLNTNNFIPQTTDLHPYKNIRELRINPESFRFCSPQKAKGKCNDGEWMRIWDEKYGGKNAKFTQKKFLCCGLSGVECFGSGWSWRAFEIRNVPSDIPPELWGDIRVAMLQLTRVIWHLDT